MNNSHNEEEEETPEEKSMTIFDYAIIMAFLAVLIWPFYHIIFSKTDNVVLDGLAGFFIFCFGVVIYSFLPRWLAFICTILILIAASGIFL